MSNLRAFKGHSNVSADRVGQLIIPTHEHLVCDVSAGDYNVSSADDTYWQNCRVIWADVAGLIKFDYVDEWGNTYTEVMQIPAGTMVQVRNVTKVYQYYTGQTVCTAQVYDATGAAVVGLKLRR